MGDPFFDLGNFSINHELGADEDAALLAAYDGPDHVSERPARLARLTLMRIVSDFREAMWGVLQQGISTLDVDFVAYAGEHFDRLLAEAATPRFERALRDAAAEPGARAGRRRRSARPRRDRRLASATLRPMEEQRSIGRQAALVVVVFVATLRPARRQLAGPGRRLRGRRASGAVASGASPGARRVRRVPADRPRGRVRQRRRRPSFGPDPSGTVVLTGAGDIADCGSTAPAQTSDLLLGQQGGDLHRRRQRLRERHGQRVRDLLRPDVGPGQGPDDPAGRRQPRLGHAGRRRLSRLLRRRGRAARASRWYSTRHRGLARRSSSTRTARRSAAASAAPRRAGGWPPTSRRARPAARWRSGTSPGSAPGEHGDDAQVAPFWDLLHRDGAELVINGHDHDYERFAPQDPSGREERPAGSARSSSGPAARSCGQFGRTAAEQRVPAGRDLRRPAAHAPPGQLRLGVPARRPATSPTPAARSATEPTGAGPRHGPTTGAHRPIRCAHGGPRPGGDHRRRRRRDVDRLSPRRARLDRRRPRRPGGAHLRLDVPLGRASSGSSGAP